MSFLTNFREFFKRDPDDPRVQGGVGIEFSGDEERDEQDTAQTRPIQTEPPEVDDREVIYVDINGREFFSTGNDRIDQERIRSLARRDRVLAENNRRQAKDAVDSEQTDGSDRSQEDISPGERTNEFNDDVAEQSPQIRLENETPGEPSTRRPTDPGEDDKGATQSTDSSGETVDQASNIEAGNVPLANPLSVFASHSAIISLFVLGKEELRDPETYRKKDPEYLIARTSGLGEDGDNITPTIFEENLGIRVEYFLDDLEVESILAQSSQTRQTNATTIRFTLKEPYSMGMLLKSLQYTVFKADCERTSYIDPPYLIKIEFKGFNDNGEYVLVPGTTRYIPIKLTGIEFNVNSGGSEYEIQAVAWNDQALADETQIINENLSLSGRTIEDFLTSGLDENNKNGLQDFLNDKELDLTKSDDEEKAPFKEKPDNFIISFPDSATNRSTVSTSNPDQGATTQSQSNITTVSSGSGFEDIIERFSNFENNISKSRIVVESSSAGTKTDGTLVEDEEGKFLDLRNVRVRNDGRLLQFPSGMRIQDIIEEVVLLSEYAKDLYDAEPDNLGYKDWFRVETRVYEQATAPDKITGKTPKLYIYSVIPYKVEARRFLGPEQSLGSRSIDELKQLAPKRYDYIYSGKNDDIINFDLQFNTAFFQGIQQDLGQNSQRNQEGGRARIATPEFRTLDQESEFLRDLIDERFGSDDIDAEEPATEEDTCQSLPRFTAQRAPSLNVNTGQRGGSAGTGDTDERTAIARNFNEIIVNGVDLITLDIEIWGDPFFIADSGTGNYSAQSSTNPYVTADNSIDYQYYEPICLLSFKTPIDYNQDGQMTFPENEGEPVAEFSGIYRIITVRNKISSNRFTQELQMIRLRNQELEEKTDNTSLSVSVNQTPPPSGFSHPGGI